MGAGMSRNNTRSLILIPLSFAALYLALNPRYNAPPPAAAQTNSFIFTAAGDYGFYNDAPATLQLVGSTSPAFNLALGDLSYSSSRPETEWCQFVKDNINAGAGKPAGDPFGETFPFQLLVGNHEDENIGTEDGFIDNYAACLPDRLGVTGNYGHQYYFDYPPGQPLARFILVDPALNREGVIQPYCQGGETANCDWLRARIREAQAQGRWVIVGMHENCITIGIKSCAVGSALMCAPSP